MAKKDERKQRTDQHAARAGGGESGEAETASSTTATVTSPSVDGRTLVQSRFAMTLLFVALAFGITLETLHGFKAVAYLMDPVRRELWTLAHFHGVALALVNLVYVAWTQRTGLGPDSGAVTTSLMAGSVLLPLGFFLSGVGHYGSDPGLGIFLAPVGAGLILFAIGSVAVALWKK